MNVTEMFSGITHNYDILETTMYKTFKETFDKKIFTVSDLEKLDSFSKKIAKENNPRTVELEKSPVKTGGSLYLFVIFTSGLDGLTAV